MINTLQFSILDYNDLFRLFIEVQRVNIKEKDNHAYPSSGMVLTSIDVTLCVIGMELTHQEV